MVHVPNTDTPPPKEEAELPLIVPPLMVHVPLEDTYTPPPDWAVVVFPLIFEPVFITRAPPLFTVTREAVLPLRPCRVMLLPRVKVTPLPRVKREPLVLRLTVRSAVSPVRVTPTFLPP
jgi:hypothetical protein